MRVVLPLLFLFSLLFFVFLADAEKHHHPKFLHPNSHNQWKEKKAREREREREREEGKKRIEREEELEMKEREERG